MTKEKYQFFNKFNERGDEKRIREKERGHEMSGDKKGSRW